MTNKKSEKEYRAWKAMKARCYAPCNHKIGNYVKNNITVCDEWINDYEKFLEDMGRAPSLEHSLDRIDNNEGYSKENCRWTTQDVQCKNRGSFNKIFTFNGESLVLKDWAKKLNIKYSTLYNRIYRTGLSFEDAINFKKGLMYEFNGKTQTLKEHAEDYGLKYALVFDRFNRQGWSLEKSLTTPLKQN